MTFENKLKYWYSENKRDLPWRNTKNPYFIWLSEIMLQQTRVYQGMPYFESFIYHFPTIFELANADEEQVLKLWQGLGYYSRARNLHQTAKYIAFNLNGVFPNNYTDLLKLKGVGSYTAAAIASFAYNEKVPVVDGNVFRFLSRYFDINSDISLEKTKKEFTYLASKLISSNEPGEFNQAIMEFGALQCVPKSPDCKKCIFNIDCLALEKNRVSLLPVKNKKIKATKRYFNYFLVKDSKNQTILNKRTSKGIWHNLYEFPLLETEFEVDFEFISNFSVNFFAPNKVKSILENTPQSIVHKLTHQHLNIKFWTVFLNNVLEKGISINEIQKYPFPIVIQNFINKTL